MTIRWIIAVGFCVVISNALPSAADYEPIGMGEAISDPPVRHHDRSLEAVTIARHVWRTGRQSTDWRATGRESTARR